MRKTFLVAVVLATAVSTGYAYYVYTKKDPPPVVSTAKVTRGNVVETVGATGQLQAVTTVQVGAQVSGTIQELYADFNSLVHKGQTLAKLDPSLFQTQIDQARANLIRAQADLERQRVSLNDAQTKLNRSEELHKQKLVSEVDLETAQVAVQSADAQLKSQQAAVAQAEASLQQNQVNLEHTIITAPIDGLVISRNVDKGQTVASSMSAPTLFVLAADLTKMQAIANLDESDVGRIRPGQAVRFRVDAYPNQEFTGTVTQLRLQPTTTQNVVTYSTVIDVPNPDLRLKPGMTANVNIEIAKRSNVLRVPNAALRFRPTAEIFQALGQTPPPAAQAVPGGRGGRGRNGDGENASANAPQGVAPARSKNAGATTIDALFGPLPPTESSGQVWVSQDGGLSSVRLRLGLSDGQQSELLQGDLKESEDVVSGVTTAAQRAATTASAAAPGIFGNQGRGFPGGGGGFPGGGGGFPGGGGGGR